MTESFDPGIRPATDQELSELMMTASQSDQPWLNEDEFHKTQTWLKLITGGRKRSKPHWPGDGYE